MKKLLFLGLTASLAYFLFSIFSLSPLPFTLSPIFAAEVEVYPGGYTIGDNATEDGHTDNHMIGQSFIPQNINKVTKIKLTNFKLGSANGNLGGIVSVALFQGEPNAYTAIPTSPEGQSNPFGENGKTTIIAPTGPMLARQEKIFIGGELANEVAKLCGVPENTIEAIFLKRMRINNPNRPCPRYEEWDRVYTLFSDAQQGMRDEWFNTFNIGTPYERHARYSGESDLLWSQTLPDYKSQPSYYEGPNFKSQTVSWQGTDNADNYLEVALPTHSLVPGQPYFLSVQQSHLDQNRSSEEGGYWEQGRYNCENPNEPKQIDLYGLDKANNTEARLSGTTFCGKGNVFVVGLSNSDLYSQGRAYFNTFYYFVPLDRPNKLDVANLKIWGKVPPLTTPTCISPANGSINNNPNNMTFTWGPVLGTSIYDFRLWNYDSAWNWLKESIIVNDLTGTSYNGTGGRVISNDFGSPINLTPGQNYRYRISARNSWEIGPWADCNFTVSESISIKTTSTVKVENNLNINPPTFQGAESTTGLQAAEGGANWYNYMIVTEKIDVTGTTGDKINMAIAAFIQEPAVGPQPSDRLTYVLSKAGSGFVLGYAQNDTPNFTSYPIEGGSLKFLKGHYYVFYNGGWRDMGNPGADKVNKEFCIDSGGNVSYTACGSNGKVRVTGRPTYSSVSTNSLTVKWDVYTWQVFGSKRLETHGFASTSTPVGEKQQIMELPL